MKNSVFSPTKQELKYFLAAAGEHVVLSELNKRFIEASQTFGNKKAVDIWFIQRSTNERKRIEVKTTMEKKVVTSFFQKYGDRKNVREKPDFWILVKIDKDTLQTEFRVLTHEEIGTVQMKRNKMRSWKPVPKGVDSVTWDIVDKTIPNALDGWNKLD